MTGDSLESKVLIEEAEFLRAARGPGIDAARTHAGLLVMGL